MAVPFITNDDVGGRLTWTDAVNALRQGHNLPRPVLNDIFLNGRNGVFLNRAAWVEGIGPGIKSVTVFSDNPNAEPPRPSVQGAFTLFSEETGAIKALIDGPLITYWKTAADSILGAKLLARPSPTKLVVIGAGVVAQSLIEAYASELPSLKEVVVLARRKSKAEELIAKMSAIEVSLSASEDSNGAFKGADIIATATNSKAPILFGADVPGGCHVDLIGAYTADMREADDALLKKASLYVDCFETTIDHIGELKTPISQGTITCDDILGDLYTLISQKPGRQSDQEITVFKNGGGAHLDLMVADLIYNIWCEGQ